VNRLLRFVGLLNAALWLGAAVFCTAGALPALHSQGMVELLGPRYYEYLSGAIAQALHTRLFHWQIGCALFAWVHLVAEWLYLGRIPGRLWVGLHAALLTLGLIAGLWLCPKLAALHRGQHPLARSEAREAATRSFRLWDGVFQAVNVLMFAGVAVYFWRLTGPEDTPRFVSPMKFR
jgi:hypothetical protein